MDDPDVMRVRVTEEELMRICRAAKAAGLKPEEWAKKVLLDLVKEQDQQQQDRDQH